MCIHYTPSIPNTYKRKQVSLHEVHIIALSECLTEGVVRWRRAKPE